MAREDADAFDGAEADGGEAGAQAAPPARRRLFGRALLATLLLACVALLVAWFERYRIADNLIASELGKRGIPARYKIEEISPTRQVLSGIVIGDPARPDLTVERLVVGIRLRLGVPKVTGLRLEHPRLRASYRDGRLSFGALDPLVFTGSKQAFEFPDMSLALDDGRARIDTDYGPVDLTLAGEGHLRSGFVGQLGAAAPALASGDCTMTETRLTGRLSVDAERPRFAGPLRFSALRCRGAGVALADGEATLDLGADRALSGVDGEAKLALGRLAAAGASLAALSGDTAFTWRDHALTARYTLDGHDLASTMASAATLETEGLLRARGDFARVELDGELHAHRVAPDAAVDRVLASAEASSEGTLAAPLLSRIRHQLAAEMRASTLSAEFTGRIEAKGRELLVPRAVLTGASGASLLSLSDGEAAAQGAGQALHLAGEFATGGAGLPRIKGRVERSPGGVTNLNLAMADYAAGQAHLALPSMVASRAADGTLDLKGRVLASGPLPGGAVDGLDLPLEGRWTDRAGLALWPGCTRVHFARLALANLALDQQALLLCPPHGSAIVRSGGGGAGLRIAAGVASLDLAGHIGASPVAIASGPVGFAWPGTLTARQLAVALGPRDTASRFTISDLEADLSADFSKGIGGRFEGADIRLNAVPLDLNGASGDWRYAGGRLALSGGTFAVEDRQQPARFNPLETRDATLALAGNVITADALLRAPATGTPVTKVALSHDLTNGAGHADLAVSGITFGDKAPARRPQPASRWASWRWSRATITGTGRIDWDEEGISSSGRFSSEDLDFAAAFGPVEGASGTVEFTDLLGLTTAPNQRIAMKTVNPGIEVL